MAIDFSKISSLLNTYSSVNTKTNNNISTNFADYLLQATNDRTKNNTIATDLTSSSVNDVTSSNNVLARILQDSPTNNLKSSTGNDLFQTFLSNASTNNTNVSDLYSSLSSSSTNNTTTDLLSSLLGTANTSAGSSDLFSSLLSGSSNSSASNLYNGMNSSTSDSDNLTNTFESNLMSNQYNILSATQSKLQANLEDYKVRNAGNMSAAVQSRIAEMANNVSTLQSYIQEKVAEKSTNATLLNQLQANSNNSLASIQAKSAL